MSQEKIRETDGALVINTDRDHVIEKAIELYKKGYTTITSLSGIDNPKENIIEIIIHVTGYNLPKNKPRIIELNLKLPRNDPWMPSITSVWASSEFHERETYEMLGVIFRGHPDLRYLLLDEEEFREVYPLRKDFIVKEEPIFLQQNKKTTEK